MLSILIIVPVNEDVTESLVIPQFIPGDDSSLTSRAAAAELLRGALVVFMEARLVQ